ncbi:MAG: hypothetical protein ACK559_06020, partial [bacterium]
VLQVIYSMRVNQCKNPHFPSSSFQRKVPNCSQLGLTILYIHGDGKKLKCLSLEWKGLVLIVFGNRYAILASLAGAAQLRVTANSSGRSILVKFALNPPS